MKENGNNAEVVVTDVADPASVEALIETTVSHHGGLHVLHNNAYWAPLNHNAVDTSWEQWQRTINTTLASAFLGCKYGIPAMIASGGGSIVNMGSQASFVASPKFAAYHAAKAGILGLTRSVAFDYGSHGIRCNVVCPGLTETPATKDVIGDPERKAWLTSKILLGRIGQPEDIADAVLFVASDEASFMTGQSLTIDGGRLIA
jgi:NAD(P)-dependent dehydrogenase (short-subunit alcohol dehydrogenase family)